MRKKKIAKSLILFSFIIFAFLGVFFQHQELSWNELEAPRIPDIYYVPQAKYVKPLLLGNEGLLADLVWIRMLGYFADQITSGGKLKYLESLVHLATDLDPRFEDVYIWAGAVFIYNAGRITRDKIEASNRILEKGWRFIQSDTIGYEHNPRYWMIPQMLGFNYAVELRDRKKGAPYIEATARIPGSPDLYKTWAATLYGRAGALDAGVRVLEDMLAMEVLSSQLLTVKEEGVKDQIRNRIRHFYERLYGKESGERFALLERRIMGRIQRWRQEMPYVSFDLFLILNPDDTHVQESRDNELWRNVFPLSGI